MWGIEEERPLALGQFSDSMVPLHGYRLAVDLRSSNEFWIGGKDAMRDLGIYCGPGLWFNRDTGRIHIRLAHHRLDGLGSRAYRGETDPRRLPLVIAAGFGSDVLRVSGIKHVRIQDLVFRGATGSPMIDVYGSEDIGLDHLTIFGGSPALLVNASKQIQVTHSVFRGLATPWTSRAHEKYRGTPSYQVILQNNQPINEDIELAWCEFTSDHDFAFLRYGRRLRFHHNLVENTALSVWSGWAASSAWRLRAGWKRSACQLSTIRDEHGRSSPIGTIQSSSTWRAKSTRSSQSCRAAPRPRT